LLLLVFKDYAACEQLTFLASPAVNLDTMTTSWVVT